MTSKRKSINNLIRTSRVLFETAIQKCCYEKVFRKYAANLQQNTHVDVRFNKVALQLY